MTTWQKFKDIFSKDMFKHSMSLAFSMSSGEEMGKNISDRQLTAIILEAGIVNSLKEQTNLLLDVPEFTLQDSSCIYTGNSQTKAPSLLLSFVLATAVILFIIFITTGL